MAITNHDRVGKALELLEKGLGPFVEREFNSIYKERAAAELQRFLGEDRLNAKKSVTALDVAALLKIMWDSWNDVFQLTLGPAERSLVSELRDHRNKWAHQETFSSDDTYRALDFIRPPVDCRLGPTGRRDREDENGVAAAPLRRAGTE